MSLLLLIDGYNVIAPVAGPGRNPDSDWLDRERRRLISRLRDHMPEAIRKRTCVVFDAPSSRANQESEYMIGGIDIRFAVDHDEADDLIEELIRAHSVPKQLAVVSSDHRIQDAARRRGGTPFDAGPWLDDLLDGNPQLAIPIAETDSGTAQGRGQGGTTPLPATGKPKGVLPESEVKKWLRDFGYGK